jgi:hypothetical protein
VQTSIIPAKCNGIQVKKDGYELKDVTTARHPGVILDIRRVSVDVPLRAYFIIK